MSGCHAIRLLKPSQEQSTSDDDFDEVVQKLWDKHCREMSSEHKNHARSKEYQRQWYSHVELCTVDQESEDVPELGDSDDEEDIPDVADSLLTAKQLDRRISRRERENFELVSERSGVEMPPSAEDDRHPGPAVSDQHSQGGPRKSKPHQEVTGCATGACQGGC